MYQNVILFCCFCISKSQFSLTKNKIIRLILHVLTILKSVNRYKYLKFDCVKWPLQTRMKINIVKHLNKNEKLLTYVLKNYEFIKTVYDIFAEWDVAAVYQSIYSIDNFQYFKCDFD